MNCHRLFAAALLLSTAACTTMQPVAQPVQFLETHNPKHVRIVADDGEFYVLRDPQLKGNVIQGFESLVQEELSVPVQSIRRMEAMQPNKTRTTLFIAGMTAIGAAGIYMIANAEKGSPLICDNYDVANRCVPRNPSAFRLSIPISFR